MLRIHLLSKKKRKKQKHLLPNCRKRNRIQNPINRLQMLYPASYTDPNPMVKNRKETEMTEKPETREVRTETRIPEVTTEQEKDLMVTAITSWVEEGH